MVPSVGFRLLPCIIERRAVFVVTVDDIAFAGAYLAKHKEVAITTFSLVLLGKSLELRDECVVESEARDMTTSVDAETIDTHFDKFAVAFYEVVAYIGVLGVEVYAVACNLTIPARVVVPVPFVGYVVPVVVYVVVLTVGILHFGKAFGILLVARKIVVVVGKASAIFLSERD